MNFFCQNVYTNSYLTSTTVAVSMEIPSSITEMDSILSVALISEQRGGLYCRNCSFTRNINEDKNWQIYFLNFVPARSNHYLSGEFATCGFVVTHFSVHVVIFTVPEGLSNKVFLAQLSFQFFFYLKILHWLIHSIQKIYNLFSNFYQFLYFNFLLT